MLFVVQLLTKLTQVRVLFLVTLFALLAACFIFNVYNIRDKDSETYDGLTASRFRRAVNGRKLWPNATIPYFIDCSAGNVPYAKEIIKAAMAEWEKRTCIRFVKRTNEPGYLFIRRFRGCWGDVGYRRGRVMISMGSGCEFKYVMMHELGHVIGFYHEHNRPDRDNFVKVFWDNIARTMVGQFNKRDKMDNFENELPYDFSSIMHYRFVAFAKNTSLDTIGIKDENSTEKHYPYRTISSLDVQKTAEMYNCPNRNKSDEENEKEHTSNTIDDKSDSIVGVYLESTSVTTNKANDGVASILVNGKELALNKPGLNIVLINYLSGKPKLTVAYSIKTMRAGIILGRFIRNLPERNYFLIVSKVFSFKHLRWAASTLKTIGFHAGRITRGSSLCFVGYKGKEEMEVRQNIASPPKKSTYLSMNIKLAQYYSCEDDLKSCADRAKAGDCDKRPLYLLKNCQKSCRACKPGRACRDENNRCEHWAKSNMCSRVPKYMLRKCKVSCGICRKALPAQTKKVVKSTKNARVIGEHGKQRTINKSKTSINEEEEKKVVPKGIKCSDKSTTCQSWKNDGRCSTDPWVQRNCLISCNNRKVCAREQIRPEGNCSEPFGIGWDRTLPDSAFNASSFFKANGNWTATPSNARLYMEDDFDAMLIGSWCSQEPPNSEWLQIDLGEVKNVTAVATQGRFRYYEHVKAYKLSFSIDGEKWRFYRHGRKVKVFPGNCDHITPVLNSLDGRVKARFVKFHPVYFYGLVCMRVEVFGCD